MTEREKIAHLLRRFGFGANKAELDLYEPLGLRGAIDRLVDWEQVDEQFPISPWHFCREEGKDELYLDPYRTALWWSLRMLMSRRPLEQKLTLFWHNHLAVGAEKVEFGPAMLQYVETLRTMGGGSFAELLSAVSKTPAMLRYLDCDSNQRGHANENFARELFELFTLGIGNFSEQDVKEAARGLTGWGIRYLIYEQGGERVQETARAAIRTGTPMLAYCVAPELHDPGPKTILGITRNFDGDQVIQLVAGHPKTAERVTANLWRYFAMDTLPAAVHARLIAAFTASKGNIRRVLREMAACEEFWSDACVRSQVKSPADFVVGSLRALNLNSILLMLYGKPKDDLEPLRKELLGASGLVWGMMRQQGMALLFPPDVSGWKWGKEWISADTMLQRGNFANMVMGVGQPDQALAAYLGGQLRIAGATDSRSVVSMLMAIFDASMPPEKLALLAKAFDDNGGATSLALGTTASKSLASVLRPLFMSPEYQRC